MNEIDCDCGRCENSPDLKKHHNDYLVFEKRIMYVAKCVFPLILGSFLIITIIGVLYFIIRW